MVNAGCVALNPYVLTHSLKCMIAFTSEKHFSLVYSPQGGSCGSAPARVFNWPSKAAGSLQFTNKALFLTQDQVMLEKLNVCNMAQGKN